VRVWLITVGEPLPTDGTGDRLHRTGQLASKLVCEGHEVVWWTSTFDHQRKKLRFRTDTCVDVKAHYRIRLLHSPITYGRNVSLERIANHSILASRFSRLADREPKPDIILCSLPTLELCQAAADYGHANGVPVVVDTRDMWPDIFLESVPGLVHPLARLALAPLRTMAHRACSRATAIYGITSHFVEWGLAYAGRERTVLDRDFPLAYPEPSFSEAELQSAIGRWGAMGVTKDKFVVCFLGTFGAKQFLDMETVIGAARVLSGRDREILFVLCGTGVGLDYCRSRAADCSNVLFPGWVEAADMWALMRLASVGLAPYQSSPSFVVSIPNKAIEYLCGGLPVISSLKGTLAGLLSEHACGVTYENGDAHGLAKLLGDLHDSPSRLADMSRNARALHESRFRAETVYQDMVDHLAQVCQSTRSKSEVAR
jgi:glycosyltransferase involved in cell wall biosynthesis